MGGSSKAVTVGYKYYVGMHMALVRGPVDYLRAGYVDGRFVFGGYLQSGDYYVSKENLFGGDGREGGISGAFDILNGEPDQTPNGYLISKLGNYVPAFRGVLSVVLRQMYLGNNPYLKKWSFSASRIHTRQDGIAQWYDAKAEIIGSSVPPLVVYNSVWQYQIGPDINSLHPEEATIPTTGYSSGQAPFGHSYSDPYPPNTNWPLLTGLWLKKTFNVEKPGLYLISGTVENCGHFYLDNAYLDSFNKLNVDLPEALPFAFCVYLNPGEHELAVWALDDAIEAGSFLTYFYAIVQFLNYSDMNPAHIIRECLTDPDWGMGYAESDMDEESFTYAADTLFTERMGISLLWDTQVTIEDFIKLICKHINAAVYVDRKTGKFILKLIRQDYDISTLIQLNESNVKSITDFTRVTFGELVNSVTVSYWSAEIRDTATLTVTDIALASTQNATINTTVEYMGFTNSDIASRVAQRDLKTLSTPLISCTIECNTLAADLNIGDCFKLSWPDYDISQIVMRVTTIAFGNGVSNRIRITCTQDVFAMPDTAFIAPSPPEGMPTDAPAVVIKDRIAFEVPYLEAVQQLGQSVVDTNIATDPNISYIGIGAVRPSSNSIDARFYTDSGSGYILQDNVDFSPSAKLVNDIGMMDEIFDIDNTTEFSEIQRATWFQIGNEIMEFVYLAPGQIAVKRGLLDTLPAEHFAGDALIFWDLYAGTDATQYVAGESISAKIVAATATSIFPTAQAPEDVVEMVGRMAKPYPPGNFKINDAFFPDTIVDEASLSWAHRDRKQQTGSSYIGFLDASIGPETGTTYNVRFYNATNTLLREVTGITANNYTYADEIADSGGALNATLRIELESERDTIKSFQYYNWTTHRSVAPPLTYSFSYLNPLDKNSNITLSGSNLTATRASGSNWSTVRSTIGINKGKWYFEVKNVANGSTTGDLIAGLMKNDNLLTTYPGNASLGADTMGWEANNIPNSSKFQNGSQGSVSGYGYAAPGQFSYFAVDFDAGKLWVKNSSNANWAGGGDPVSGTSPTFTFTPNTTLNVAIACYSGPQSATANFGASTFNGSVPSGYNNGWFAPAMPINPVFTSRFTTPSSADAQGVATDGTNIWFSSSTTIYKYNLTGTLITSRNVSGDSPSSKTQINGMFIRAGILYVSAAENSTPRKSYIVQYDPNTLAYITHNQITGDWFSEGITFKNGYWWICFHATKVVAKVDPTSWTVLATYNLTFAITGSSGGYGSGTGYDGIGWFGNYLVCNIHEIYDQDFLDVYYFDGTTFVQVGRLPRPTVNATQGFCFDPTDSTIMLFAERNFSGSDAVAKVTITI